MTIRFTQAQVDAQNRKVSGGRTLVGTVIEQSAKRIRQEEKPLLNKLEADWLMHIHDSYAGESVHSQAIRFKIGNGAWYKPDFCVFFSGKLTCWEIKGPKQGKNVDRGLLALKIAAHLWPEVVFLLVWREDGAWKQQRVLP